MRRRTNNTPEEINQSILALVNEWNISDEHNEVVATHIIGLQLKKIRLVRRLTQTKIARSVGCTFQQIQKYEKGQNAINKIKMMKLCEFLDVEENYFTKPLTDSYLTFLKKKENNVYPFKKVILPMEKRGD